jgi:hypothetical protein
MKVWVDERGEKVGRVIGHKKLVKTQRTEPITPSPNERLDLVPLLSGNLPEHFAVFFSVVIAYCIYLRYNISVFDESHEVVLIVIQI